MLTRRSSSSELSSPALDEYQNHILIVLKLITLPFIEVDISLFAHNIGIATTNSFDLRQGVHDFAFSVNIGVQQTKDMLGAKYQE